MARGEEKKGIRWRLWFNLAVSCFALVIVYYTGRTVRHFVVTDSRFTLASADDRTDGLSMEGLVHASRARVLTTFMPDFGWFYSFALFRLFDIWKPFPIRQFDAKLKNGFGVMFDDLLAATYAILSLMAIQWTISHF